MNELTWLSGPLSWGDAATCVGLAMTGIGAWVTARSVILTRDQARLIGVARYVPENPEDMDKLPHVQSLLAQSRAARWGLRLILFGALFQFGPIIEKIVVWKCA